MHFFIHHFLYKDALETADGFPVSEISLQIMYKNGHKEPETLAVLFMPSLLKKEQRHLFEKRKCHIDGSKYAMVAELIIEDEFGKKINTPNLIVWLTPELPDTLN